MIPIIIVSHKRANNVLTINAIDKCIICVPKSQESEYKEYNSNNEILVHPDEIIGLSPKRQWVLDKVGDCFQCDDDISGVQRIYLKDYKEKNLILSKKEAFDLIQDFYEIAKEVGVYLFGFNRSTNPLIYSGNKPYIMNKYICGGGLGLIKSDKLFFPNYPHFVGEDYFINALNAYHHRFSLIDARFAFQYHKTEAGAGGCADYRTTEKRKETYFFLKQKFGDAIQPKNKTTIKPTINQFEKTLKIPY